MGIYSKIIMIIFILLWFILQIGYILNVFLEIKYKLEMIDNIEAILSETYSITQMLYGFIIFDIAIISFLLIYILIKVKAV